MRLSATSSTRRKPVIIITGFRLRRTIVFRIRAELSYFFASFEEDHKIFKSLYLKSLKVDQGSSRNRF